MNWNSFQRYFTPELQRAMRYSVEESIRKSARSAGGGRSDEMADMAVESFIKKLENHTGQPMKNFGETKSGNRDDAI